MAFSVGVTIGFCSAEQSREQEQGQSQGQEQEQEQGQEQEQEVIVHPVLPPAVSKRCQTVYRPYGMAK